MTPLIHNPNTHRHTHTDLLAFFIFATRCYKLIKAEIEVYKGTVKMHNPI